MERLSLALVTEVSSGPERADFRRDSDKGQENRSRGRATLSGRCENRGVSSVGDRVAFGVSVALAALILAACGSVGVRSETSASTATAASVPPVSGHHTLYFRPVLCELPSSTSATSVAPTTYPRVPPTSVPLGSASTVPPTSGPPGSYAPVPSSASSPQADYPSACDNQNLSSLPDAASVTETAAEKVIAPYYQGTGSLRYVLGPADMTGVAIATAQPIAAVGQYEVQLTFTAAGAGAFDSVAAQRYSYYRQNPSNPPYQSLEAIELDGKVVSAPTIQAASFNGTAVISGSSSAPFSEEQASVIAQEIQLARAQS